MDINDAKKGGGKKSGMAGNIPVVKAPQGNIKGIGKLGNESSRGRFLRSLNLAIEEHNKTSPQGIAKGVVSLAEHEALKEEFEETKKQVDWLVSVVEAMTLGEEVSEEADEGESKLEAPKETEAPAARAKGGRGKTI